MYQRSRRRALPCVQAIEQEGGCGEDSHHIRCGGRGPHARGGADRKRRPGAAPLRAAVRRGSGNLHADGGGRAALDVHLSDGVRPVRAGRVARCDSDELQSHVVEWVSRDVQLSEQRAARYERRRACRSVDDAAWMRASRVRPSPAARQLRFVDAGEEAG